jgi:hypothetical protein
MNYNASVRKFFWTVLLAVGLLSPLAQSGFAVQEGPTFNLSRSSAAPDRFDLIMSDGNETVVSGSFSQKQMEVFRDVLTEARKFAMSEEEAGKTDAKTTRIASNSQPALFVDISKTADQSRLFITYSTEIGRITISAGRVQRPLRREDGLFFNLLMRMEALLPAKGPSNRT